VSDEARAQVTRLLRAAQAGDREAAEGLMPLLHQELRKIALGQMRRQHPGHTLQATDLVHEAYLRLAERESPWESRKHFFCTAARAMRSILVDHARARSAQKRGGDQERVPLHDAAAWFEERSIDLVALDEALERLRERDESKARVVELRFFAGLGNDAVATLLGVSRATVEREWAFARAWLHRELGGRPDGGPG
jgi:RNA polymerase sigma factor (TIGR02999 family)